MKYQVRTNQDFIATMNDDDICSTITRLSHEYGPIMISCFEGKIFKIHVSDEMMAGKEEE